MINVLPLTIEGLVATLLLLTILYCVRLNNQLKRLKADETSMQSTIGELVTATENAQRAIAGLKNTVLEADETLGERLRSAERFCADIVRYTEAGSEVLTRITQIAGVRNPATETLAVAPKPAVPDPKAIVAAAQAFAERARARIKGVAA